jgi:hypothetical protein
MTARLGCGLAVLGMLTLALSVGCDRPPSRVQTAPISPSGAGSKAMELFDTNKDGKISGAELDKAPGLKASLPLLGTDKDKGVTAKQISDRAQKWLDSLVGRMPFTVSVYHNGNPLAGATIKLVPEKFLSEYLTVTPVGKTNETGRASVTLPTTPGPDGDPVGMSPGMYRVEITKDGETIPAKYNTETTIGQEVSQDNQEIMLGIKYNLTY